VWLLSASPRPRLVVGTLVTTAECTHSYPTTPRQQRQGIRNNYLLIIDKVQKNRGRLQEAAKGPDRHSSSMVC